MQDNTYIYYVQCPMDHSIKFLASGTKLNVPKMIKDCTFYLAWKSDLKANKVKPIYQIIDKVENTEIDFWLEFYRDLFYSWEFPILEKIINEKEEENNYHLKYAKEYLECGNSNGRLKNKVLNINVIVYLINDLIDMSLKIRKIDEHCLLIICTFMYGKRLSKIVNFTFRDLFEFHYNLLKNFEPINYPRLERFILSFAQKYSKIAENENRIFQYEILNAKHFEKGLNRLLSYYGYNQEFKYDDHVMISGLLCLRIHGNSGAVKKAIEKHFNLEEKYIYYHLINSTNSKFILMGNQTTMRKQLI